VRGLIDGHRLWIARAQDNDFGIDLEAELARSSDGRVQQLLGKLLKVQVKGSEGFRRSGQAIALSVSREYLEYAQQFRVPVILVAADVSTAEAWWVWLQDWVLRNEKTLAERHSQSTITLDIPTDRTLAAGLGRELPRIAAGEHTSSLVLALRELAVTARSANNIAVIQGVFDLLDEVDAPSRAWALERTIDSLIGLGPAAGFWQAQQFVPQLLAIVERVGGTFTQDQVVRLIWRGDSYSRVAMYALAKMYDDWLDHTASLRLPSKFRELGLESVAWYCDFREGNPTLKSFELWGQFGNESVVATFGGLRASNSEEAIWNVTSRWPNIGDSIFLDLLEPVEPDH
jgi:hypothetical protein